MDPVAAYELLSVFSSALAHRLRTPLAVIFNELSLCGPEPSSSRPLEKCRELAAVLSSAALESLENSPPHRFSLVDLLRAADLPIAMAPECAGVELFQRKNILAPALRQLTELLTLLAKDDPQNQPVTARAGWDAGAQTVNLAFRLHRQPWDPAPLGTCSCESLTQLCTKALGVSSFLAPLVDAALAVCGGRTRSTLSSRDGRGVVDLQVLLPQTYV